MVFELAKILNLKTIIISTIITEDNVWNILRVTYCGKENP